MKEHLPIREISASMDGDLPERRQAEVEAHLEGCARCRARREELRTLVEEARERRFEWETRDEVWDGIFGRIRTEAGPGWRRVGLAVLAASVAAVFVLEHLPEPRPTMVRGLRAEYAALVRDLDGGPRPDPRLAPSVDSTLLSAQREVSEGLEDLLRRLEADPGDPVLTDLVRRALERKAEMDRLVRETTL